jgi:hypothetical protein
MLMVIIATMVSYRSYAATLCIYNVHKCVRFTMLLPRLKRLHYFYPQVDMLALRKLRDQIAASGETRQMKQPQHMMPSEAQIDGSSVEQQQLLTLTTGSIYALDQDMCNSVFSTTLLNPACDRAAGNVVTAKQRPQSTGKVC